LSTSSISSTVRSGAKAVTHGVKCAKKAASAIVRPLKHRKHALSQVSTPTVSDVEEGPTVDAEQGSVESYKLSEVIEVSSDSEELDLEDLEKALGMHSFHSFLYLMILLISVLSVAAQKTWRSPVYSFFKSEVNIQVHAGHVAHFFTCAAKQCRSSTGGVLRYQDKADKSSTANLWHHERANEL
jgi:hypothetical protein